MIVNCENNILGIKMFFLRIVEKRKLFFVFSDLEDWLYVLCVWFLIMLLDVLIWELIFVRFRVLGLFCNNIILEIVILFI